MIGDKIIILDIHKEKASIIFKDVVKKYNKGNKFIISIAGISGTGKTEVGQVLQDKLWNKKKIRSKCVHIDDYYKTTWKERNKIRKRTNLIGKEEINWKKLNKVLIDFKKREKFLHVQRIHKYLDNIEYTVSPNNSIDILILEGLYALYADHFDFGIYLEGNYDQTYGFRKMRNKENPDNKFRTKVVQIESRSVWNSKQNANKIIKWKVR